MIIVKQGDVKIVLKNASRPFRIIKNYKSLSFGLIYK